MASGTFLEVDRAELTKRLRNLKDRQVSEFEKARDSYPDRMAGWNAKVAAELVKLAGRMNGISPTLIGTRSSPW